MMIVITHITSHLRTSDIQQYTYSTACGA